MAVLYSVYDFKLFDNKTIFKILYKNTINEYTFWTV